MCFSEYLTEYCVSLPVTDLYKIYRFVYVEGHSQNGILMPSSPYNYGTNTGIKDESSRTRLIIRMCEVCLEQKLRLAWPGELDGMCSCRLLNSKKPLGRPRPLEALSLGARSWSTQGERIAIARYMRCAKSLMKCRAAWCRHHRCLKASAATAAN